MSDATPGAAVPPQTLGARYGRVNLLLLPYLFSCLVLASFGGPATRADRIGLPDLDRDLDRQSGQRLLGFGARAALHREHQPEAGAHARDADAREPRGLAQGFEDQRLGAFERIFTRGHDGNLVPPPGAGKRDRPIAARCNPPGVRCVLDLVIRRAAPGAARSEVEMKYASVIELKRSLSTPPRFGRGDLVSWGLRTGAWPEGERERLARRLDAAHARPTAARAMALGLAAGRGPGDFRLGVRIHASGSVAARIADEVMRRARGEADVRMTPHVRRRLAPAWFRQRRRPLEPGLSIGQGRGSAGTLGAIVEDADFYYALSNNHVLADVNRAEPGAPVWQPGDYDRHATSDTLVGVLDRYVPISFARANVADAAVAQLFEDVWFWQGRHRALNCSLAAPKPLTRDDLGRPVVKAGRTTGVTRGRVTLVDLDGLRVDMSDPGGPRREALFSDGIEVQGDGGAFSDAGDSGSLIVDLDGHARALLFCGTVDPEGPDLTYGNRIEHALGKLGVTLVV